MLGGTAVNPTDVFGQFQQSPLQAAAGSSPTGVGSGGVVAVENAPATTGGQGGNQLLTGNFLQQVNPLTGQIEYVQVPQGYVPASSGTGFFSELEASIGKTATFVLVALGLVAAIVIIPRILPKQ